MDYNATVKSLVTAVNHNQDVIALYQWLADRDKVKFDNEDAINYLFSEEAEPAMVSNVDLQQIVSIAKAACQLVAFLDTAVCPLVNKA